MKLSQRKTCFPLERPGPACHRIIFRVREEDITYVVTMFEAWDCVGVARTIDRSEGLVEVLASPDFVDEATAVTRALEQELDGMEIVVI